MPDKEEFVKWLRDYDARMASPADNAGGTQVAAQPKTRFAVAPVGVVLAVVAAISAMLADWQAKASYPVSGIYAVLFAVVACACVVLLFRWRKGIFTRTRASELAGAVHSAIIEAGGAMVEVERDGAREVKRLACPVFVADGADSVTVSVGKSPATLQAAEGLQGVLEYAIGLPLATMTATARDVTYTFSKRQDGRLVVEPGDFAELNPESTSVIPLSSELSWDMAKVPHGLVCGSTGGGKSVLINYLCLTLLRDRAELYICDAKRSDLYGALRPVLGDGHVASTGGEIARVARLVADEMERRYELMEADFKMGSDYRDHPEIAYPVVWVFDEMAAAWSDMDKRTKDETLSRLTSVVMKGRQSGVYVILCTQQPRSETISTQVRDQLGFRVSLGSLSQEGYSMCYGSQGHGYDFKPREGKGVGYIYLDDGTMQTPRPFDAPWVDFSEIDFPATAKRLYEANPRNRDEPTGGGSAL